MTGSAWSDDSLQDTSSTPSAEQYHEEESIGSVDARIKRDESKSKITARKLILCCLLPLPAALSIWAAVVITLIGADVLSFSNETLVISLCFSDILASVAAYTITIVKWAFPKENI